MVRLGVERLAGVAAIGLAMSGVTAHAQIRPQLAAPAAKSEQAGFDVYLPLSNLSGLRTLLVEQQTVGSPHYHRWLTPRAFAARFGAHPGAVARVMGELRAAGLEVRDVGSHALHAEGSVAAIERLFAAPLTHGRDESGRERLIADGALTLPDSIREAGANVAHFAATRHMRPHARRAGALPMATAKLHNRTGATGPYWFDDLKQAYGFPSASVTTGAGARIGILMSGAYNPSDIAGYFAAEGLAAPTLATVPIYGGAPFDPNGDSVETELDIQQAGGMAPGAAITLFNLPDLSDASILAGLTTIVETNATDIVNMSFGAPEISYTAAYNGGADMTGLLSVYDDLFMQGSSQGITFVASSGDSGGASVPAIACFAPDAKSGCGGFVKSTQLPASSPNVTSVGGTNLVTTYKVGQPSAAYVSEAATDDPLTYDIFYGTPASGGVWGSGGGISAYFTQPAYQKGVSTASARMRLVPDLAWHMGGCPSGAKGPCGPNRSSDVAMVNGQLCGLIGTSAGAPAFAGVMALKVQLAGGRQGNVNYSLYAMAKAQAAGARPLVFHTGIAGTNGPYRAGSGYNLVLGNGTPYVAALLGVANQPLAGNPMTPSNP